MQEKALLFFFGDLKLDINRIGNNTNFSQFNLVTKNNTPTIKQSTNSKYTFTSKRKRTNKPIFFI